MVTEVGWRDLLAYWRANRVAVPGHRCRKGGFYGIRLSPLAHERIVAKCKIPRATPDFPNLPNDVRSPGWRVLAVQRPPEQVMTGYTIAVTRPDTAEGRRQQHEDYLAAQRRANPDVIDTLIRLWEWPATLDLPEPHDRRLARRGIEVLEAVPGVGAHLSNGHVVLGSGLVEPPAEWFVEAVLR